MPVPRAQEAGASGAESSLAVVVVIALVAVAGVAVGRYLLYHPEVEVAAGQPVHVVVEQGATTAEIADMLAAAGVIDNALMFRYQARESGSRRQRSSRGSTTLATGMPYDARARASSLPDRRSSRST